MTFRFGQIPLESYEPPYPQSYRLNSTINIILEGLIWQKIQEDRRLVWKFLILDKNTWNKITVKIIYTSVEITYISKEYLKLGYLHHI